ncbi:hypothetical protein SESBI_28514 [Sesbania bispinosa]|nr:hypothetical protein SESBI_28514 [Sesbania bispinosa]
MPSGSGETSKSTIPKSGNQEHGALACEKLPFNIQTIMQVEVVGPNHLRFIDEEDKPPDPSNDSEMTPNIVAHDGLANMVQCASSPMTCMVRWI